MNETNPDSVSTSAEGVPTQDEKTWGMLAHLAAFGGFLIPILGNVIGPLIVWLLKRNQSGFVADQGRESLNFNISVLLASIVCGVLVYIFIGILLGVALFVFWLSMTIIAGIKPARASATATPSRCDGEVGSQGACLAPRRRGTACRPDSKSPPRRRSATR